jgi:hypothetical protein
MAATCKETAMKYTDNALRLSVIIARSGHPGCKNYFLRGFLRWNEWWLHLRVGHFLFSLMFKPPRLRERTDAMIAYADRPLSDDDPPYFLDEGDEDENEFTCAACEEDIVGPRYSSHIGDICEACYEKTDEMEERLIL